MGKNEQGSEERVDAVVVGAGFGGLYMLHRLRQLGFTAKVIDVASGVGGTWFWNRYPGARCDIESIQYSYQFSSDLQEEWTWSERYAKQPEILRYLNHVADRLDLRSGIDLETRVERGTYDEDRKRWRIETSRGTYDAQFFVMATGCLSARNRPEISGMERFTGRTCHTGDWPADLDLRGKRVAVIGTGSSAVQSIPVIAKEADRLFVFQRTPTYTVPAHNRPLAPAEVQAVKADYANLRAIAKMYPFGVVVPANEAPASESTKEQQNAAFEGAWQYGGLGFLAAFGDLVFVPESNAAAADFVRRKIHEIVKDPAVAKTLTPHQTIGCKRLCLDDGYYETFNRDNVTLIDVSGGGIQEITQTGVRANDTEYVVDVIVFATGFDAMTGAVVNVDIRGRGGRTLRDKWAGGPSAYLGLAIEGFPNLFTITGPGSPSVLTNMVPSIEQHVEFIADCMTHVRGGKLSEVEATGEAERTWMKHVGDVAGATLFTACNSWYLGSNIEGKSRMFMPYIGFPTYLAKCNEVVSNGYEGFALT